jgi:Holliday junction resolvase RusA-like endonuclease
VIHRKEGAPVAVLHEVNGERLQLWRSAVADRAIQVMEREHFPTIPRGMSVYLVVLFLLPRPLRPLNELPVTRPDLDKLTRAVMDALTTAGAYRDDAQVTDLVVRKRYAEDHTGARIAVRGHAL